MSDFFTDLWQSPVFTWAILPLLIFLARIVDVSISTIRMLFIMSGKRNLAPFLGFCESLIWLLAIGQIMQHLSNVLCYVAYAGGFAAGTFVGMVIEERLAIGLVAVRVITRRPAEALIAALRECDYRFTAIEGTGNKGRVNLVFGIIRRTDIEYFISLVKQYNPNAFYSIENVRGVSEHIPSLRERNRSFVATDGRPVLHREEK